MYMKVWLCPKTLLCSLVYKFYSSERFDLLGNSLAILSGIASPERAGAMIDWIEAECLALKKKGQLGAGSAS